MVTTIAAGIGLALVNTIRPGDHIPQETKGRLLATYGQEASTLKGAADQTEFGIQTLIGFVPRNPFVAVARPNPDMLALIFVALMGGVGLTIIAQERAQPALHVLEGINDISVAIINIAMKLAPFGVAALIFSITSRFGFDLLVALGWYVVTVLLGLALHQCGVFSILVKIFAL